MNIATSITEIKITGNVRLFSTSAMITKIATIETMLTIRKSRSVVSIISFIHGASPISIPPSSYFFRIEFNSATCALTSSLAQEYSNQQLEQAHLLSALCGDAEGVAPQLLTAMGVDAAGFERAALSEVEKLTNQAVAEALDGLPAYKMHCSVLAEEAIHAALEDYRSRQK